VNSKVHLTHVFGDSPPDIDLLRAEAARQGYRFLERLVTEWISRRERFAREGEALLAAYFGSELAGIGGMTIDPAVTGAWRMRRFLCHLPLRQNWSGSDHDLGVRLV
jgi:hypothetical protein